MTTTRKEEPCGCEILIYGDGSAEPEIVRCHLHEAAADLRDALADLKTQYTTRTICPNCDEDFTALPDCVSLFKTNVALRKAEGKSYVAEVNAIDPTDSDDGILK